MKRPPGWSAWFVAIVGLEVVSLATVFVPEARAVATILAGALMAVVAMRRPDIGLAALFAELAIGSKGALLKIPVGAEVDGGTSLRIILVGTFLVGWFVNFVRSKPTRKSVRVMMDGRTAWIAVFIMIVWATIRGAWLKNGFLVSDANAWGYLILLVPVLDVASRDGRRLLDAGRDAFIAALAWLPIKTLAGLYIWSHGIKSLSQPLYLWIRRTGVGEVTLITGNLFRVFIQSQIYAVAGLFGLLSTTEDVRRNRLLTWLLVGSVVSLLVGLSRSLWIGLGVGGIALLFSVVIPAKAGTQPRAPDFEAGSPPPPGRRRGFLTILSRGLLSTLCAVLLVGAVVAFPLPFVEVGSLANLFGSRASTGDAAAESRWNLLPILVEKIKQAPILGSGFGASVTYKTKDPRIVAQRPDGMYTTYAFEWGWLEFWIKFGILGIPVMLWLLVSIGLRFRRTAQPQWVHHAGIATLIALGALHVFTPYLNHPLGFGMLLAMEAMIEGTRRA